MKNKIVICLYVLLFIAASVVAYKVFKKYSAPDEKPEECHAHVVINRKNRADITLFFVVDINKKTGNVSVGGSVDREHSTVGLIDHDVDFTFTENGKQIKFTSVNIQKDIKNETLSDSEQLAILPDFYVLPGKSIIYTILPQGGQGYLFLRNQLPHFFCTKRTPR